MALAKKLSYYAVADYLEGEKVSDIRHEYIDGEICAMAGESRRHNTIASNFVIQFRNNLTNCEIYFEGVKVRANQTAFYYPDMLATCETEKEDDDYVIKYPCLIVEALLPSTASTDKREKLIAYKMIESLQEYAIVWQDEMRVELHRRNADGWLTFFHTQPKDEVEFASVNLKTNVTEIYRGVSFPQ